MLELTIVWATISFVAMSTGAVKEMSAVDLTAMSEANFFNLNSKTCKNPPFVSPELNSFTSI